MLNWDTQYRSDLSIGQGVELFYTWYNLNAFLTLSISSVQLWNAYTSDLLTGQLCLAISWCFFDKHAKIHLFIHTCGYHARRQCQTKNVLQVKFVEWSRCAGLLRLIRSQCFIELELHQTQIQIQIQILNLETFTGQICWLVKVLSTDLTSAQAALWWRQTQKWMPDPFTTFPKETQL